MSFLLNGFVTSFGFGMDLVWVLLFLPVPILLTLFKKPKDEIQSTAIRASHFGYFTLRQDNGLTNASGSLEKTTKALLWLAWCFFIVALARPFVLGEAVQKPQPTRDIMLAVDLSESMADADMQLAGEQVTRLTAAKSVLSDFIDRRYRDRLGLLFFADTAYLASPLTTDAKTLRFLLSQSQVGLIGDATSITDAIGLTTKLFTDYEGELPALILLTDGDNTSGNLSKTEAVNLALSANIQIFAIVLGPDFGQEQDDIDLSFLQALTDGSGGELFFATDAQSLAKIYNELDERALNPTTIATHSPKYYLHLYSIVLSFLFIGLLLASKYKNRNVTWMENNAA